MRIGRLVPCPRRDLWWALIANAEPGEHGVILYLPLPGGSTQVSATITRYESQTLLECCCNGDLLRWELEPIGEFTTQLVFTYGQQNEHWTRRLDGLIDQATCGDLGGKAAF